MNKKAYIPPHTEEIEIEASNLMLITSIVIEEEEEGEEMLVVERPKRRGVWGDLWAEPEEPTEGLL